MMRVISIIVAIFLIVPNILGQTLSFSGYNYDLIPVSPSPASSLNSVFVAHSTAGLQVIFESTSDQRAEWFSYGTNGSADATPINNVMYNGRKSYITLNGGDIGLLIISKGRRYLYWISDYSRAPFTITKLEDSGLSDCSATRLHIDGSIPPLNYMDPSGRIFKIPRLLTISYTTQKPNDDYTSLDKIQVADDIEAEQGMIVVSPPAYCTTTFSLSGDNFLKRWGLDPQTAETAEIYPIAVDAITSASIEDQDIELSEGITADISAPADIVLYAIGTEALIHPEWQIASDPDFSDIILRRNESNTTFHLDRSGFVYIKFTGHNAEGTCSVESATYIAKSGESSLRIPNTFFPGSESGASLWKVTAKGLITFSCDIFDRNGKRLFTTDNPEAAWDGSAGGKMVAPGVYFYVIKAIGADGVNYNKKGHINVLRRVPARIR